MYLIHAIIEQKITQHACKIIIIHFLNIKINNYIPYTYYCVANNKHVSTNMSI